MPDALNAYWWSPRHSLHDRVSELLHHRTAWRRLRGTGESFTNFGDALNRPLLEAVTGRRVTWAPLSRASVVAIGSILGPYFASHARAQVWGSGIHDPAAAGPVRPVDFLAVRGPMTRDAVGLSPSLPLGDPGLLVGRVMPPSVPRGTDAVVIPHFTVFGSPEKVDRLTSLRAAGYRVLVPTLEPTEMIREIAAAGRIFSSGMHGVILAHSLGRGATSIRFDDDASLPFKYDDYYGAVGIETPRAHLWHELLEPAAAARMADRAENITASIGVRISEIQDALLIAARGIDA